MAALPQVLAIGRSEHSAAAGGQHAGLACGQLVNDSLLQIAKSLLAFALKKFADGQPHPLFDHLVGIQEGPVQAPRELPPDGRFPGPGKANECNMGS